MTILEKKVTIIGNPRQSSQELGQKLVGFPVLAFLATGLVIESLADAEE